MKNAVIYHGDCMDGFCAAWLFWHRYPDAEFIPANYNQPRVDLEGQAINDLFIVDFSYPLADLRELARQVNGTVTVLDHHQSAVDALGDVESTRTLSITLDTSRSGGRLAWEFLHPGDPNVPWLVDYTEDRDLWRWALEDSQEVNAALRSYPMEFDAWEQIDKRLPRELAQEGAAILRYKRNLVDALVRKAKPVKLAGFEGLAVNCSVGEMISEVAGSLAEKADFGATWTDCGDGTFIWSLRSRGEEFEVLPIAKHYGGGGHPHAAGFTLTYPYPKTLAVTP